MVYTYTVIGRGRFPMDMLRYDCAWPKSTGDCVKISENLKEDFHCQDTEVELVSNQRPTLGRWNSFGWGVLNIEERK